MAVPKRKQSKQRSATRYANWKATPPNLSPCPQCHELKESHRVCKACGYYDGEARIQVGEKKK